MSALEPQYVAMLEKVLDADFIPHLPPLIDTTKPAPDQLKKNRSRAFSAFAIRNICQISAIDAAKSVVDAKNIRSFLGHKTDVNSSIQRTLDTAPEEFLYLNNGVTVLCEIIESKSAKGGKRLLKVRGLSVINGAQTIASSARFASKNDISKAKVSLTLIKAGPDSEFGKSVTRARNHQNPVRSWDFAALDDEQERLRRDLAHLGITYAYKAGGMDTGYDQHRIRIDEAAQALAVLQPDPRYVVWLKKEPTRFLNTEEPEYKALFNADVSAFQVANAVRLNRYLQSLMLTFSIVATGPERLAYKHGNHAAAWVLAKRLRSAIKSPKMIDDAKLKTELSKPLDDLRQTLWDNTRKTGLGPLALFRNQSQLVPLLCDIAVENYGLTADPVVEFKKKQQKAGQLYPEDLFAYIAAKAPQIANLI